MPDTKMFSGLIIGVLLVVGIAFLFPKSDEAIPPTPAFQTIYIVPNATFSSTGDDSLSAIVYNDDLFILTDNSIGINITSYSP